MGHRHRDPLATERGRESSSITRRHLLKRSAVCSPSRDRALTFPNSHPLKSLAGHINANAAQPPVNLPRLARGKVQQDTSPSTGYSADERKSAADDRGPGRLPAARGGRGRVVCPTRDDRAGPQHGLGGRVWNGGVVGRESVGRAVRCSLFSPSVVAVAHAESKS